MCAQVRGQRRSDVRCTRTAPCDICRNVLGHFRPGKLPGAFHQMDECYRPQVARANAAAAAPAATVSSATNLGIIGALKRQGDGRTADATLGRPSKRKSAEPPQPPQPRRWQQQQQHRQIDRPHESAERSAGCSELPCGSTPNLSTNCDLNDALLSLVVLASGPGGMDVL